MEEKTFANQDLSDSCFDNQELANADFSNSNLRRSSFKRGILTNANFNGADVRGCDFAEANLAGASFENSQIGVDDERFIEILLKSIGISAFIGVATLGDGTDTGISTEDITYSYSVSMGVLATFLSFAGVLLFLFSIYKTWLNAEETQIFGRIAMTMACATAFMLSAKKVLSLTREMSSTSFKDANLSGAHFDNTLEE